jgi:drug/metabolite transporter (DMT)-like permease
MCFVFGAIYITGALFLFTEFSIPSTLGILTAVYIGLFEMGITFILWMKALSLAKNNARIAGVAYLTPFISLVFIHLIVGETIAVSSVVGLSLIVSGILIGAVKNPEIAG